MLAKSATEVNLTHRNLTLFRIEEGSDDEGTPTKKTKINPSPSDSTEGSSKKLKKRSKSNGSQGDQEADYSAQPQPQSQQVIEASHRAIMKNFIGNELQQLISSTTPSGDHTSEGPIKVTCNKFVVKARVGSLNQLQAFIKRSFGIGDGDYKLFYQDKHSDKIDIDNDAGFDNFLHDSNHIYVALARTANVEGSNLPSTST